MTFERTRTVLAKLEHASTVTAEDIFGVFNDLCEDAKDETGLTISEFDTGDEEGLIEKLPRAGRMLLKSYARVKDGIENQGRKERLAKISAEISELNSQCETAAQDISAKRAELEKLNKSRARLEDVGRECNELKAEIARVGADIDELSKISLPDVRERLQAENKKREELQNEHQHLSTELEKLKGQLTQQQAVKTGLEADCSKRSAELQSAQSCCEAKQNELKRLEDEIARVQSEHSEHERRIIEKQSQLERINNSVPLNQSEIDALENEYAQASAELTELEERKAKMQNSLRDLMDKCAAADNEANKLKKSIYAAQQEQEAKSKSCEELRQSLKNADMLTAKKEAELEQLKNECPQSEFKKNYDELQRQITELKDRLAEQQRMEQEADAEINRLVGQVGAAEQKNRAGENYKRDVEEKLAKLQKQIDEAQADNERLDQKLQKKKAEQNELEERYRALQQQINEVKGLLGSDEFKLLRRQTDILSEASTSLKRHREWLMKRYPEMGDNASYQYLAATDIDDLKKRVGEYRQRYITVIRLLEKENM